MILHTVLAVPISGSARKMRIDTGVHDGRHRPTVIAANVVDTLERSRSTHTRRRDHRRLRPRSRGGRQGDGRLPVVIPEWTPVVAELANHGGTTATTRWRWRCREVCVATAQHFCEPSPPAGRGHRRVLTIAGSRWVPAVAGRCMSCPAARDRFLGWRFRRLAAPQITASWAARSQVPGLFVRLAGGVSTRIQPHKFVTARAT